MSDQPRRYSDEKLTAKDLDVDLTGEEWNERTEIRLTSELVNRIPEIVSAGAAQKAQEITILLDTFLAELQLDSLRVDNPTLGQSGEESINNAATALLAVLARLKTLSAGDKRSLLYTKGPTVGKEGTETYNSMLTAVLGDIITVLTRSYKQLRSHVHEATGAKAKGVNQSIESVATGILDALDMIEDLLPQSLRVNQLKLRFSVKAGRELARGSLEKIEEEESVQRGEQGYAMKTRNIPAIFWKVVGLDKIDAKRGQKMRSLQQIWESLVLKALKTKDNPTGPVKDIRDFLIAVQSLRPTSCVVLYKTGFLEMAKQDIVNLLDTVISNAADNKSLDDAQRKALGAVIYEQRLRMQYVWDAVVNMIRTGDVETATDEKAYTSKVNRIFYREDHRVKVGRILFVSALAAA